MTRRVLSATAPFQTFAILVALAMAGAATFGLMMLRWNHFGHAFALEARDIFLTLTLAWAMVLSIQLGGARAGPVGGIVAPWVCLGLLAALAPGAPLLFAVLICLGTVAGIAGLVRKGALPIRDSAAALVVGALLGAMHVLLLIRTGYAQPLAMEAALHGLQHRDTLFHAAIVSSLRAGGPPSLSLDGTVPITYHVLSHQIIAVLADWLSVTSLNAYTLFVPIVAGPVLVGTFLWTAGSMTTGRRLALGPSLAQTGLLGWVLLAGFVAKSSMWVSESFMVSLWAVFAAAAVMHAAAPTSRRWIVVLLPVFVLIAGMAKISVGAVLACGVAVFVAHLGRWRVPALIGALAAGPAPFLWIYVQGGPDGPSDGSMIAPLAFLLERPEPAIGTLVFAVALVWGAWRAMPEEGPRRALALGLVATMLAGVCAGFLLDLPAGAQLYFTNPGILAGLFLIPALGLAPGWMLRGSPRRAAGLVAAGLVMVLIAEAQPRDAVARLSTLEAELDTPAPLAPIMEAAASADAIHVAAGPSAFWALSPICWTSAFTVQAIAQRPLLMGLPAPQNGCVPSRYYGFADYDPARSSARPMSDTALCEAAQEHGYTRILVVDTQLELRDVHCEGE